MTDVMDEFASVFFLLITQAQKYDAKEKLELINIFSIPYMKPAQQREVIKNYKQILMLGEKLDYDKIKRDRQALIGILRRR